MQDISGISSPSMALWHNVKTWFGVGDMKTQSEIIGRTGGC